MNANAPVPHPLSDADRDRLQARVRKLSLDRIKRHLFLCAEASKPLCCDRELSSIAWEYLKRRIAELNLEACVFRTKANCLRVCEQGPILLVYPEGIWYRHAVPEVLERVLQEHVLGGCVVEDYAFARSALWEGATLT